MDKVKLFQDEALGQGFDIDGWYGYMLGTVTLSIAFMAGRTVYVNSWPDSRLC